MQPTLRKIMITGSGGANGIGFTRSLRAAPEPFHLVGVDAGKFHIFRSQTDERHLVPRADNPMYIPVLREIVEETGADLISVHQSAELMAISAARNALGTDVMLPDHESIAVCDDKFASYQAWRKAGLPVPGTVLIESSADIDLAFQELGRHLWIRSVVGSGGRDALPVDDAETAQHWISSHSGWGRFTAATRLSNQSFGWESIWCDGELLVAQGRWRIYWEFGSRSPSGVTGITGAGITGSTPDLDLLSEQAILAIDPRPNGIFSVDITLDKNGCPNLTEINCGRFFTTHQFFTALGLNMPYIFVKAAFGEALPQYRRTINPLPDGMVWIRGMDREPVLTSVSEVEAVTARLEGRTAARGSKSSHS